MKPTAWKKKYPWHVYLVLFCSLLSLIFILTAVRYPMSDGHVRFETFTSLLSGESTFSKYSTVQPFIAYILHFITNFFVSALPVEFYPRYIEVILLIIFFLFFFVFEKKERIDLALVLSLLPLSMLSHYVGQFFSELTSSLLIAIGFIIYHYKKHSTVLLLIGSLISAIGLANWPVLLAPATLVAALATSRYFLYKNNEKEFIVYLSLALSFGVIITFVDLAIKGHLIGNPYASSLEKGYRTLLPYSGMPGFSNPVLIGLLGSLFSFGKSVFLFNPFLIFIFLGRYEYKFYLISFFVCSLLIYSSWWAWYGGFSFGTRFYIFLILPSIYLFIKYARNANNARGFVLALVLVGAFWLSLSGKYFGLDNVAGVCARDNYAFEAFCWYVPEFSPLIHPFVFYDFGSIIGKFTIFDWLYGLSLCLIFVFLLRPIRERVNLA